MRKILVTYIKYSSKNNRNSDFVYKFQASARSGRRKILALKTGIGQRNCFVTIDSSGKVKKVVTPGTVLGLKSDVHGNSLVWDEIAADPRWGRRDYSEIRLYDLKLHIPQKPYKKKPIFQSRFLPRRQIQLQWRRPIYSDNNFLTLISSANGTAASGRIPSPGNKAIQFPEWISGTGLAVITVSALGKQIERVDLNTGEWTAILPYTRFDISEPLHFRQFILFRSSYQQDRKYFCTGYEKPKRFTR